jgi:hypothetical protein
MVLVYRAKTRILAIVHLLNTFYYSSLQNTKS